MPDHDAYLADLRDWGVQHPFVFWKDTTASWIRIAPLGRWTDAVQTRLEADGSFSARLPSLDTTLAGRLSIVGEHLRIDDGTVTIGGSAPIAITVQGEYLPEVPAP